MSEFQNLKPELQNAIHDLGFEPLTAVQKRVIPQMLAGHSLFVQAKTGSGKTAAYLIPIIQCADPAAAEIQALILAPTRELAVQIQSAAVQLSAYAKLHVVALIGGRQLRLQINALRNHPAIVIATPGRLLDLLHQNLISFRALRFLILDEADQLLSLGQKDEVEEILQLLPAGQTALFSATWDQSLAHLFPGDFVPVIMDDPSAPAANIKAYYLMAEDRPHALLQLLSILPIQSALVFVNHISDSLRLSELLQKQGMLAASFSSHFDQAKRLQILRNFRAGSLRILIATDAAARGLDIMELSPVIQLDLPLDQETYIHRLGRSGHQGQEGVCVSVLTEADKETSVGQYILANAEPLPNLAPIDNHLTEPCRKETGKTEEHLQTILIRAGRNEKIRPKDLVGALCTVLPFAAIGTIEIQDRYSVVTILDSDPDLIKKLQHLSVKGKKRSVERKHS